ncbi:hypothetical protein [Hypericibacter sp.]|uniref:hypothetical protein n=1 Tax=Hypericibacter sp. TaxID=2705401 RepID=UPI003D6D1BEC
MEPDLTMEGTQPQTLGGIPVSFSAIDGASAAGLTVGIAGRQRVALDDKLSLTFEAIGSRSRNEADVSLGTGNAWSGATVSYHDGALTLALQPNFALGSTDATLQHLSYGLTAWAAQQLWEGVSAKISSGFTRETQENDSAHRADAAMAEVGLSFDLPAHCTLDLGYRFAQSDAELGQFSGRAQGPRIGTHWALSPTFRLGLNYAYDNRTDYSLDDQAIQQHDDALHRMDVEADWDIGGDTIEGLTLTANYHFENAAAASDGSGVARHVGTVNVAFGF